MWRRLGFLGHLGELESIRRLLLITFGLELTLVETEKLWLTYSESMCSTFLSYDPFDAGLKESFLSFVEDRLS